MTEILQNTKIAFVIPALNSGGAERVVTNLANELSRDYDVTIITFSKVEPFYSLSPNINLAYCLEKTSRSKNLFQALNNNYTLSKKIYNILKKDKIQLAIAFLTSANYLTAAASTFKGIPCIISERIDPFSSTIPLVRRIFRRILYPRASYVVVQTSTIKKYFSSWIKSEKLVILPNPLSPNLAESKIKDPIRKNVVLNIGRLTNQKGQDVLIKAFSAVNPKDWELKIIGEGVNRSIYEKLIESLDAKDKISLLGQEKDVSKYYNNASIFAFTSRFEGFPNALTEAMYYGLPCISTDCPTGPSELIAHGENGFMIPVDDQKELESFLSKLIKDEKLRTNLGENASITAKTFEMKNVSVKWRKLIEDCLQEKNQLSRKIQ